MTNEELNAIRERADLVAKKYGWHSEFILALAVEDVPKLLAEIERLRGNIATIEALTKCVDTKDFAKRALNGEATIRI